jgi:GTPase SAR1 family protein
VRPLIVPLAFFPWFACSAVSPAVAPAIVPIASWRHPGFPVPCRYASEGVQKLLVGNKSDLAPQRQVEYATAKQFADELGVPLLETSAKTATNVELAFIKMASEIKAQVATHPKPTGAIPMPVGRAARKKAGGGCC